MIEKYLVVFVLVVVNLSLIRCPAADYKGIIIKSAEQEVLLATDLSLKEYERIKDFSAVEIQNADVLGDAYYGLINLTYEDTALFHPGDIVEVWIDGEILEAYPPQAKAKKIVLKKEFINY